MKVTKKPIEVSAWKVPNMDRKRTPSEEVAKVLQRLARQIDEETGEGIILSTNEEHVQERDFAVFDKYHGWVPVSWNQWIIRGVNGEFYPCDHETFVAGYDVPTPQCVWVDVDTFQQCKASSVTVLTFEGDAEGQQVGTIHVCAEHQDDFIDGDEPPVSIQTLF